MTHAGVATEGARVAESSRGAQNGLARLRSTVLGLGAGRRAGLGFSAGGVAAMALPPFYALPLLIVSFGVLLWLIEGSRGLRAAAAAGWWFGFGYFLAGLYWIGHSFQVDAERFGWLAIPAVVGLSAFLALYPATATAGAKLLGGGRGAGQVFALAVTWTAAEWLRGHLLSGFPWNLVGYAWTVSDAPIQVAAAIGIYGLSFLTVCLAALPALLADSARPPGIRRYLWPTIVPILAVAVLWIGGEIRLALNDGAAVPDVRLRLVQANIPQALKWRPEERQEIFSRYRALSLSGEREDVTHVVWPEAAVPFFVADEPKGLAALASVVPEGGLLLTGALRKSETEGLQVWNSLFAITDKGEIVATYDKAHLVPFGEYVPFRGWLPFDGMAAGVADTSSGPGLRTLELNGLPPVSPLICYEAIFPGAVVASGNRPEWLLNVTNDAWFGTSTGPYQHFAMARVRAVEEGVPLVRAANTGISGVVDAYGRVTARLGLNETGVIDAALPQPAAVPTPYSRFGDWTLAVLLAAGLAAACAPRRSKCAAAASEG